MGYGKAVSLTAVGDAVNTASRLESASKEYECELVVSEDLVARAGANLAAFPRHEIELRGRRQVIAVRTLTSARHLPELAAAAVAAQ
jgi:adenylate cyclase